MSDTTRNDVQSPVVRQIAEERLAPWNQPGSGSVALEMLTGVIGLSPRECEIVRQVARDRSNKQIAVILGISEWTVSTHLRRVFAKLGVHNRAAMIAAVIDRL